MEVHGTVYYESQRPPEVPAFVKNHGLLPQPEFQQLLRKAKVSPPLTGSPSPAWTPRRAPHMPAVPTHGSVPVQTGPSSLCCPGLHVRVPWGLGRAGGAHQAGEAAQG